MLYYLLQNGQYVWDKKIQNHILAAYFYGYLTTQILGGYLSLKLGAKITLGGAILIGSVFTILVPLAANMSYMALIACRFITGIAHVNNSFRYFNIQPIFVTKTLSKGAFWPSMSSLWVIYNNNIFFLNQTYKFCLKIVPRLTGLHQMKDLDQWVLQMQALKQETLPPCHWEDIYA